MSISSSSRRRLNADDSAGWKRVGELSRSGYTTRLLSGETKRSEMMRPPSSGRWRYLSGTSSCRVYTSRTTRGRSRGRELAGDGANTTA
eukprot:CAMPEP_0175807948 /NCGR_PEP_ID=MMETSP0107_2-20121207/1995_1 /TAXON_ID=195067 ORGANISM="Goniomonas pacifica, Strain CCMP1869" /NCGR_SAMPLE_ID=MMETSP0107_2 /ASSEMBLY_ACC=CAM_ASM_000203 /LENGTH=88 /DNA_ID=CAMNT_0017119537 /DNA_START=36 /DNA_END=299 /DNA_ORIENTATION=+